MVHFFVASSCFADVPSTDCNERVRATATKKKIKRPSPQKCVFELKAARRTRRTLKKHAHIRRILTIRRFFVGQSNVKVRLNIVFFRLSFSAHFSSFAELHQNYDFCFVGRHKIDVMHHCSS